MEIEHAVSLSLNHYQAANLRWLLALLHDGKADEYLKDKGSASNALQTGDWCGELRWLLEQEMIEKDVSQRPNATGSHYPPLQGTCCGMKKADYDLTNYRNRIDRIGKVLALKDVPPDEKVRMVEELAKGWVNIHTMRAISESKHPVDETKVL